MTTQPKTKTKSRNTYSKTDRLTRNILLGFGILSSSFIFIIAIFITLEGIIPFVTDNDGLGTVNLWNFLTGTVWLSGRTFVSTTYGVGYVVLQTLYLAFLSLLVSFPVGVMTALFIAKIAPKRIAEFMRGTVELMASIPSIVFGLVGAGFFLPIIYDFGQLFGISSAGGAGTLGVVLVLSLMSLPTIIALSEVSIRSVDVSLEQASLALGATPTQTRFKIILLAAKNGIFSSAILAIGRSLGEATAVALVAGNARSGPNFGLFDITSTMTSMMLSGLKETTGIDFNIRFSVGLLLMIVILLTNITLNVIKRKVGNFDA